METGKEMMQAVIERMERQLANATARIKAHNVWGWVICLGEGNTFATLKVISETPANTSINFAGTWEDARRFSSIEDAKQFMRRFDGQNMVWSIKTNAEYANHVVTSYARSLESLREALKAE